MSAIILSEDNFEAEVLKSDVPVLIDFWAVWCGPCSLQSPELAKFAKENEGKVKVAKLNVDDFQKIALDYDVTAIPTLILFKDGKEAKRVVGFQSAQQLEEAFLNQEL